MSRHGKRRTGTADVMQHAVISYVMMSLRVTTGHYGTSPTKFFLNRFIPDFYSRRQATVEEHWTRSLRFLSTELANAAFTRDGAEVAAMAVAVPRTLRTDGNLHPNGGTWLTVRQCHGRWRRRGGWFSGWRLHARRCRRGAAAPRAAGDRGEHGENSHRSHGGLFLWRVAPGHGPGGVCDDPHCTGSSGARG